MRRFNNYRTWKIELAPYRSDLHLIEVPDGSRPLVDANETFREELFPFGLNGEDHLLATVQGCDPAAVTGNDLRTVVRELLGSEDESCLEELKPFLPVRVVAGNKGGKRIQATVQADGVTVDFDLSPSPRDEDEARRVIELLVRRLRARKTRVKTLRRLE